MPNVEVTTIVLLYHVKIATLFTTKTSISPITSTKSDFYIDMLSLCSCINIASQSYVVMTYIFMTIL